MGWLAVILFAVVAGAYTGIVGSIPAAEGTSFKDIAIPTMVGHLRGRHRVQLHEKLGVGAQNLRFLSYQPATLLHRRGGVRPFR